MARKSNKTDHVLSLLSSGGKDKAEKNTAAPKPPVEPDRDISTVSIVQASSEKEGLAEKIKKSLEEEMEKMGPEIADEDEGAGAEITEQMQALHEADEDQQTASEPVSVPEPESVQEPVSEPELVREPEQVQEPEPVQQPAQQDVQAAREKKEEIQEEFAYVNVMEKLVKEKVVDYMKQFGNCTCLRCVADTTALALTQLPPKYVVINSEAVSPLMNFYTKKYAGQITVEITKACIRVGEVPRHGRG